MVSLTALVIVVAIYLFAADGKRTETAQQHGPFLFRVDGTRLNGHDLQTVERMDGILLTAGISRQDNVGWTSLTPARLKGICGALLTNIKVDQDGTSDRSKVYRVDITTNPEPFGDARDKSKDSVMPITVYEGACLEPERMTSSSLSMPAPINAWGISSVNEDEREGHVSVTFDPIADVDYDTAMISFDPIIACQAAMDETFPSSVTPVRKFAPQQMTVIARNLRGNRILNFSTYRSWDIDVAGPVCVRQTGSAG